MRMDYRMMDIIRWDPGWLDQNWGDKLLCFMVMKCYCFMLWIFKTY